jgi:hypothetical protein
MKCQYCKERRLREMYEGVLRYTQKENGTDLKDTDYQSLPPMVRGAAEEFGLSARKLYESLERLAFVVMDANPQCKEEMVKELHRLGIDYDFCALAPNRKAIGLAQRKGFDYTRWVKRAWAPLLFILQAGGFMLEKEEPHELAEISVDWR